MRIFCKSLIKNHGKAYQGTFLCFISCCIDYSLFKLNVISFFNDTVLVATSDSQHFKIKAYCSTEILSSFLVTSSKIDLYSSLLTIYYDI